MKLFDYDISTLFGGLGSGSNNIFNSINLSDYNSIKTGSYKKLLKSYYNEASSDKKTNTTDKTNTSKKTASTTDTTGLTKMKKNADELKETANSLGDADVWKKTNGEYDKDKILKSVKDFTSKYNDVISQEKKVDSKDVSTSVSYMKSMTSTMSKALEKIGISVDTNGKLSVDEDKFKAADMSNAKTLFAGNSSYASQIADRAGEVSRSALMNSSLYSNTGVASSTLSGMFEKYI